MAQAKVTILGSNGNIGNAAMAAFQTAGWAVTGLGRTNRRAVPGTRFIAGDAADLATVQAAIADADVVVQALHLRYDRWGKGRAEAQLKLVLDAMKGTGKTLLFPGTIYNYRATDRVIEPQSPQVAEAPRGAIRIRLEQMLQRAAREDGIQVIILRAGDFYGHGSRGEWFEAAMLMDHAKGRLYHLGDLRLRHSWAYLPDLARAFVALADRRESLGGYENFHFAGHWVSHQRLMNAITSAAPKPLKASPLAWWMLAAAGLINPVMRDIYRMRYLWRNEMELRDSRLDALLGDSFGTPFETAVAETVADLLPHPNKAA